MEPNLNNTFEYDKHVINIDSVQGIDNNGNDFGYYIKFDEVFKNVVALQIMNVAVVISSALVTTITNPIQTSITEEINAEGTLKTKTTTTIYDIMSHKSDGSNVITHTTTEKIEIISITYGSELYINEVGFFDSSNTLIVTEDIDISNYKSKITYLDLTLCYYNSDLIIDAGSSYWVNILKNTGYGTLRKMELKMIGNQNIAYFEFETSNILTSLETSFCKDTYTGNPTPVDINFERFDDQTSQYILIETVNLIFPGSTAIETLSHTFTNSNPVATSKYRLRTTTEISNFNLYVSKIQANKQTIIENNISETTNETVDVTTNNGMYAVNADKFYITLNEIDRGISYINDGNNKFNIVKYLEVVEYTGIKSESNIGTSTCSFLESSTHMFNPAIQRLDRFDVSIKDTNFESIPKSNIASVNIKLCLYTIKKNMT